MSIKAKFPVRYGLVRSHGHVTGRFGQCEWGKFRGEGNIVVEPVKPEIDVYNPGSSLNHVQQACILDFIHHVVLRHVFLTSIAIAEGGEQ